MNLEQTKIFEAIEPKARGILKDYYKHCYDRGRSDLLVWGRYYARFLARPV